MEYFSYGIGDFSFCFIYGAIGSYIVFFYTDVACISAATVGTILLLSKIFDGISDMLMGYVIENVHSPLGKARPWLLWMAIPYCAGSALLFTVPDLGETGRVSAVSCSGMENGTVVWPAAFGQNVVLRRRSHCMRPRSSTASARPVPKGFASASSAPFSQMRSCAAKTISVVDSPCPASA